MNNLGRWSLAVAVLAIAGWMGLHARPHPAPAAFSRPSAAVNAPIKRVVPAGTLRAPTHEPVRRQDWVAEFHAAGTNYFEFVTRAAQAAYAGDGAAQYYVGSALARCEETNALYAGADDADQAVSHLAFSPALLELERREYLNCEKFRSEDAFKGLPERPGGYPAEYWRSRAIISRFPVAMVAAALESPAKDAPQMISAALATGNAEAMLLFGWRQATANGSRTPDSILGAAWVLAACRGGADCGPTNDALPLFNCREGIELGCTERYTAIDELTEKLNSPEFDQASLLAQEIQANLLYRDPSRLAKFLPLMQ